MRAAVFRGVRSMPVEQVPDPVAGPRDIVLRVKACGVCGTDLHSYTTGLFVQLGQVMGHEFAGEVVEVGASVSGIAPGDRVTGIPIQPCGTCRRCRSLESHLCEVWSTRSIAYGLPGGYAELLRIPDAVPGRNVHRLADTVTFEDGALVEPLAVSVHAVRRARPDPGDTAVVLGLGPIGLSAAQVLLASGVSPVVGVDLSPLRRQIASKLGIRAVGGFIESGSGGAGSGGPGSSGPGSAVDSGAAVDSGSAVDSGPADSGSARLRAAVDEALGGREADMVFEATGAPSVLGHAVDLVRPGGTVVVVALYEQAARLDGTVIVQKELAVRGSAMVTPEDFRDAIGLLASGRVRAAPLVTQRVPLDEIGRAFEIQLDRNAAVKVLVKPEPDA